ncbi:MAG: hypothetical protein RLY69_953 [Verrucomicrobiota bacterium]
MGEDRVAKATRDLASEVQCDLLAAHRSSAMVEVAVGGDPGLNAGHGLVGVDLHKDRATCMLAGEVADDGGVFQQRPGFFGVNHEVDERRMSARLVLSPEFVQFPVDGMDWHFSLVANGLEVTLMGCEVLQFGQKFRP